MDNRTSFHACLLMCGPPDRIGLPKDSDDGVPITSMWYLIRCGNWYNEHLVQKHMFTGHGKLPTDDQFNQWWDAYKKWIMEHKDGHSTITEAASHRPRT